MFLQLLAVLSLLLYYLYMSHSPHPLPSVPRPSGQFLVPPTKLTVTELGTKSLRFYSRLGSSWRSQLPPGYVYVDKRAVEVDECYGLGDGVRVKASGRSLYRHLVRRDTLLSTVPQQKSFDAASTSQDLRKFFFVCRGGRIETVDMCPSGQFFFNGTCKDMNDCVGKPNKTRFPDPFDLTSYYECKNEIPNHKTCPAGLHFIDDTCRASDKYCQSRPAPLFVDFDTLLVCDGDRVTFKTCPSGQVFFPGSTVCEWDTCRNQPDDALVGLPKKTLASISYSPGYSVCSKGRVVRQVKCDQNWGGQGYDPLYFLPMVFDGNDCVPPKLCSNVVPTDPELTVPVRDFSTHVADWPLSVAFDAASGYVCEGKRKRKKEAPAGQRVGKRMRLESACDTQTTRAVVAGYESYFDCATGKTVPCSPGVEFFDGVECRKRNPAAHSYENVDIFRLDNLSEHNWMVPWDYEKKEKILSGCADPTHVFDTTYNVCVHPDCRAYPFLSQMPALRIDLRDGGRCRYVGGVIERGSAPDGFFLFWSQKRSHLPHATDDVCTPGMRTSSGNFLMDRTLFATCEEAQPFVFCPSNATQEIREVSGRWACVPNVNEVILPHQAPLREYARNELASIHVTDVRKSNRIVLNNRYADVPLEDGLDMSTFPDHVAIEAKYQAVRLVFKNQVTHPPDVVVTSGQLRTNKTGGFLMKTDGFTHKPLHFPTYGVKEGVPGFPAA